MTVTEWRKKHKRCEFCTHLRFFFDGGVCRAKNKFVFLSLPRPFCRLFQVRETDI